MLKVVLLVVCIAIAIGSLIYFFFLNRILGYILGIIVRLRLWSQDSAAVWVDFGSAHFSLIAGRILFRDVRYHSSNQTFRTVKCQLSWRWWIRDVAEEEDLADGRSDGTERTAGGKFSPRCRIHVSLEGFEWFMYNRSASFDNILSELSASNPELSGLRAKSRESNSLSVDRSLLIRDENRSHTLLYAAGCRTHFALRLPSFLSRLSSWVARQLPDLSPRNLLPLSFDITKGAITMGNHTTESLLLAQFTQATGTFGIVQPRSKLDEHRQLLRIAFKNATISCVENPDYWTSNRNVGKSVAECFERSDARINVRTIPLTYASFKKLWARCRNGFQFYKLRGRRYAKLDKELRKRGKEKAPHEEASHVGADFLELEYAIDRKLLEAPLLEILYYADVAGLVPTKPIVNVEHDVRGDTKRAKELDLMDIGNGDLPPEWGVDIVLHGGAIHYGPWADRQRIQLQRVFFPQTFQTHEPTATLSPGDRRTCTCLKLFFEFQGVTTALIPFREASKNWQWDGLVNVPRTRKQREPAAIQLRLGEKSTVKYLVPMVATPSGYSAELDVFMDTISVTSSLNDIRLLEANSCSVSSTLPSPLQWNSERSWHFAVSLDRPVLYIIRDHVNMLADLGKDWSSGPPSDFNTFAPITYSLNLTFHDYELNLYANDHNIIDRPLDRRENVLFTFRGGIFKNVTSLPSNKFRPLFTEASFSVICPDVALSLTLPRWNTHGLAASSVNCLKSIGQVGLFRLDGSYTYYSEVRNDCIDRLKLNVEIPSISLKIVGWMLRHVMVLRDNYFGGFTQYSTTREYLNKLDSGIAVGDPLDLKYRTGKSNVFHFDLSFVVRNCTVALPAGVVGFERAQQACSEGVDIGSCAVLVIPELQVQLRLHDFSMEMSLHMDPVSVSAMESCPDRLLMSHTLMPLRRQLSISGIQVSANRLFGPQPHTSTYVCIWKIALGNVKGSLSTMEAHILAATGKSFGHGFVDPFNAPSSEYMIPSERDATFLKVTVESSSVTWKSASTVAVRLCLDEGLQFAFNNIAGTHHRKLTSVIIPAIELQVLMLQDTSTFWLEAGRVRTGVSLDLYSAPKGWRKDAEKQRSFLKTQDSQTRRFASMIAPDGSITASTKWSNSIYLQSIHAPRVSLERKERRLPFSISPRTSRLSTPYSFMESDSDDDLLISEADRDERLAKSRPANSAPFDKGEDGHSSSAFDESDETDNEGSEESWSDYFEREIDGRADYRLPYLAFCRKLHLYRGSSLDFHTDFTAQRQTPPIQCHLFSSEPVFKNPTNKPRPAFGRSRQETDGADDTSKKYIRVDVKNTGVFLTGLCFTALDKIQEQDGFDEISPELRLDNLMLERISAITEPTISVYDVQLHSIKFCFVHEVARLLQVQSVKEHLSKHNHAFAIMTMDIEGVQLLIGLQSSDSSSPVYGRVYVGKVAGSMESLLASSVRAKRDAHAPSVAIEFTVNDLAAAITDSRYQITYDVSTLRLFQTTPEVMIAAAEALQKPVKEFLISRKSRASLARLATKQLVCSILAQSTSAMSKDLLSSVQPAFFVQSGHPRQLRGDYSWKLLFHLRHSLSCMSTGDYELLKQNLHTNPTVPDVDRFLLTRQVPWALEEGIPLANVELIDSLIKGKNSALGNLIRGNDSKPAKFAGFHANSTCLTVDGGDLSHSSLILREIDFRADLLTRRLVFEAVTLSPYSSTIRSYRPTSEYVDYGSTHAILALDIDAMQITVFPSIIGFMQNAVHAWRILLPPSESRLQEEKNASSASTSFLNDFLHNRVVACDVRFALNHLLIEAAAENIIFEVMSQRGTSFSVAHVTKPVESALLDVSVNHTMGFHEFAVKARTRNYADRDMDTLASITTTGGISCLFFQTHPPHGSNLRGTLQAASLELSVPRSAIRLYKFIEQWRQDYLLGIDAMLKSLFTEIRRTPERPSRQLSAKKRFDMHINVSLSAVSVILQVMHGTWLGWTGYGVIGYLMDRSGTKSTARTCGLQIASQVIRLTSTPADWSSQRVAKIVLDLPSISASGTFNSERSSFLISVGFLKMTIKPSHWDSLLSVQQKFGQDFNDLLLILGDAKSKYPGSSNRKASTAKVVVPLYVTARFEGFKIGLEGLSSTQFLECVDIDAMISNKDASRWHVNLTDLALYLSPRSLAKQKLAEVDRNQLPVLVSVNLQVKYHPSSQDQHPRLEIEVTKLHAILQAHLMGDIGDFADHLQSELMLRKEQRAADLGEFKEKAMKVMKTFNLNPRKASFVKQESFMDKSSITISMANFGAVFPLDLERKEARKIGSDKSIATKALLLSIKSFRFETQKGESGEALMEGFCFQFVSRFDPSNPDDFSARRHQTLNQMLYPQMTARMRMETLSSARHVFATASISGFILDLDPSITSYLFSLVDAYRHGKQRVEQLAVGMPRSISETGSIAGAQKPDKEARRSTITSKIEASLTFMSGTVRMHCTSKDSSVFASISPDWPRDTYQILDSDAEIFNLPEVSLSAEYSADARQLKTSSNDARSPVVVLRSTVHSSRNSLRPLVLLFVSGIVHNVEERMKQTSHTSARSPSSIRHSLSTVNSDDPETNISKLEHSVPSSLQLFVSLRIDKSRLEFTCRPDVNVIAGVNWESGGFIFNMGPGAKGVSISASIEGLTIGLKHGFLSEDSAHIDARNLMFSINFSKTSLASGHLTNSISTVVDTEFSGGLRFSRFQDLLCFKAVWLDHIPVFKGDAAENSISPSRLSAVSSLEQPPKQGFDTAVVIRVRRIALEADLGQSISTVTFDLQTAMSRIRLTSEYSELSVSFARVDMLARGNLSGHLKMPDFAFRTVRRRQSTELEKQTLSRILELNLTSGTLDIQLQSDWLWLLQYRAEPLEARIYDDWTVDSSSEKIKKRQLHLYSSVSGSKVIAMMTIMALPKLLMYAGKLRTSLEMQREGASRESSAFRSTRLPKTDNALSEVANAIFRSARTKLKETETLSYVINQHMKLELGELVFVVLPRSQGDNELARFKGRDVVAQLHRTVQQANLPAHRDLQLSLSYMSISQLLKQGFDPRLPGQVFDLLTATSRNFSGTENVVFSLPAMDMRMITDEGLEESRKVLPYDFFSNFARREGQKGEDIHISFNIRLYSWLTILRKTFTRELKRAQEVADWKSTNVSPPNLTAPKLASPDASSSPFAFDNDGTYSPNRSPPSSSHSSRPSSPVRSRSSESVILTTPSKTQNSHANYPLTVASPKFGLSEAVRTTEQNAGPSVAHSPPTSGESAEKPVSQDSSAKKSQEILYVARSRKIERLTVKQLGEATPDVMHPFFTKRAGFNLEESLPQYVHEYATLPIEEIMKGLVKLYSKQLN